MKLVKAGDMCTKFGPGTDEASQKPTLGGPSQGHRQACRAGLHMGIRCDAPEPFSPRQAEGHRGQWLALRGGARLAGTPSGAVVASIEYYNRTNVFFLGGSPRVFSVVATHSGEGG